MLDLEAELKHVRAASKMPVAEIMVDMRHARRGVKDASDELDLIQAEEKKRYGRDERAEGKKSGASSAVVSIAQAAEADASRSKKKLIADEHRAGGDGRQSPIAVAGLTESLVGADAERGLPSAGVKKLATFVEEAAVRLSAIDEKASECIRMCKGLGEYFGEGAEEAQSTHILTTLVQFLDLLAEAKEAEGLC